MKKRERELRRERQGLKKKRERGVNERKGRNEECKETEFEEHGKKEMDRKTYIYIYSQRERERGREKIIEKK